MSTHEERRSWSLAGQIDSAAREAETVLMEAPPFPRNIMIELSNACNHACVFCANTKMTRPRTRMDAGFTERLLRDAHALGARKVGFYTTGDPFVHRDLEKFIARASELGYSYIYLSTNGALATPDRVRAAVAAGLDSIKFSINAGSKASYEAIHGKDDWDVVMANLDFVVRHRETLARPLYVGITYVELDRNRAEAEAFRAAWIDRVDDVFVSGCDLQQGYMDENRGLIQDEDTSTPIAAPCHMVFNRAHVTCEGYLTLCCVDYQNYLALEDLNAVPLADAWTSERFRAMRRRHLADDLDGTLCANCIRMEQRPVAPLVPSLATLFDFDAASSANAVEQQARFVALTVDSGP